MVDSVKADAQQRIENVVNQYRKNIGEFTLTWKVKENFRLPDWIIIWLSVMTFFSINIILAGWIGPMETIAWCIIALFIMAIMYWFISKTFKCFKEKVWHSDQVSVDDLLYICENNGLKPLIKEDIQSGCVLTYASLLEKLPDYLSRIEAYHAKIQKEELIRRIDQI
ncbi:hypothetical protein FYL99_RS20250 [Escherichia coli]|nr:hypothetical protein [Escherichia coli]